MASEAGNMPDVWDSRRETLAHSQRVGELMVQIIKQLLGWIEHWPPEAQYEADQQQAEAGKAWLAAAHEAWPLIAAELARSEAACASAMAEVEALTTERDKALWRLKKLKETIDAFPDANDAANLAHARSQRDAMRPVVEAAKAVRELWRYDAMGAAQPEIHDFVAAVDALSTQDGA